MSKPVPKWLMEKYAKIWNKYGTKSFRAEDPPKITGKEKSTNVVLSQLRKSGWLESNFDPKDNRKRIYRLREPNKVIVNFGKDD